MNKQKIATNATILWKLMNERDWTLDELRQASNLNENALAMAIGWLVREDSISIIENEKSQTEIYRKTFNSYNSYY